MSNDLFPETLLAEEAHGDIFTTSLKIADHFHKQHSHVIRSIELLIEQLADPAFSQSIFGLAKRLIFEAVTYLDRQKKPRPMYRLSRDAFSLVTMGFTGVEALKWQIKFIAAFNAMEAQLRAHIEREAAALQIMRPTLLAIMAGTGAGKSRTEIAQAVDRTKATVTRNRATARRLGLLPQLNS